MVAIKSATAKTSASAQTTSPVRTAAEPAPAVRATAPAAMAAATMLSKSHLGYRHQTDGSDPCEKNFQQGGFPHLSSLRQEMAQAKGAAHSMG